ncbi:MAG: hypothetical protein FWD73_04275 [Polyangiaceae bacterium]|nr:hypothetical protein [Polyangiaceae bacterium]
MAERFVRGWKVAPDRLQGLVGSKQLAAVEVLKSEANANYLNDVFMTLGDDKAEGKKVVKNALEAIFKGPLELEQAYEYARVTELLLNHAARPCGDEILMQLTYYMPNDAFGRWNPVLKILGLPVLAGLWGETNLTFPWPGGTSDVDWPAWTLLQGASLEAIEAELKPITREHLNALSDAALVDEEGANWGANDCRDELWAGLEQLRSWVTEVRCDEAKDGLAFAKQGNSLLLLMDGSQ